MRARFATYWRASKEAVTPLMASADNFGRANPVAIGQVLKVDEGSYKNMQHSTNRNQLSLNLGTKIFTYIRS